VLTKQRMSIDQGHVIDVPERPLPEPSSDEKEHMANFVIETVSNVVHTRRLHLTPTIQDYDRLHRDRVTRTQFRAALASLGFGINCLFCLISDVILALKDSDANAVMEKYADEHGDVLYKRFIADVEGSTFA